VVPQQRHRPQLPLPLLLAAVVAVVGALRGVVPRKALRCTGAWPQE